MDLNMKWIMGGIIVGVLFSILGVFKVLEFRSRRRMQTLRCPECGGSFVIPGLGVIKRWIEFDVETARRKGSGFYLHCAHCAADFRYRDDLTPLGRVAQEQNAAQRGDPS